MFYKRKGWKLVLLTSAVLVWTVFAYAETDTPRIRVATELGVEADLSLRSISLSNSILAMLFTDYYTWNIPLEIASGVYLAVPIQDIERVTKGTNQHSIVMKDGKEWQGKLFGKVTDLKDKTYNLSKVTSLNIIELPEEEDSLKEERPLSDSWVLKIAARDDLTFRVVDPFFAFNYYSSLGYITGGATHEAQTNFCYLTVNGEEHIINIDDFVRLSIQPDELTKEYNHLSVETKSGVKTAGTLVLREEDEEGEHESQGEWFLTARAADDEKIVIALNGNDWVLEK
jgi:hypothetical protein